ncbi:BBE domain-containing protein [Actinoplanes teichomyceticus]
MNVPSERLRHKDNCARLQRVKASFDPGDMCRHAVSVRP